MTATPPAAGAAGTAARTGRTAVFLPLPTAVDLPAFERETLARWTDTKVFQRSLDATAQQPLWVFYEGPPTANGKPGAHHVEARVFKDLFPRYRTMKGYHVPRRAGWDCHGLPVELAVEKELGFTSKADIEAYGIAEFNALCRESVLRHVADFEAMTERMGYWTDLDNAYRTMDTSYVESVWWSLKQIFEAGLLVEDFRITPYCPRDETPLSDHEVSQGYSDVDDPSVYVRFPITSGPLAGRGAALLVWTTTPWTLVSNTAVAVHPDVTYVLARTIAGGRPEGELLVVAEPLLTDALGEHAEVVERLRGTELAGTQLRPAVRAAADRTVRAGCCGRCDRCDRRTVVAGRRGDTDARPLRGARRLRHHHRRHRPGPPGARVRRRGPRRRARPRPARGQPDRHRRSVPRRRPVGRRHVLQGGRRPADRRPALPRPAVRRRAVLAQLPALLAVPHAVDLLPAAVLVRPDDRDRGPAAGGERQDRLAPGADQARSLRRMAAQQRRLGAVPQPLLGYAAADLALHRRRDAPGLRRVAGRAVRTRRGRPHRARPAPALRRRRQHRLPDLRCHREAGARGDRRLVRLGRDAVRPVGRTSPQRRRVRPALPGAVHLRGDRPDPWLVLHADGDRHPGVRQVLLRDGAVPGPAARRRGPQDEQAPGQRARPAPAFRDLRRRRGAVADAGRRLAVGGPAGRPRADRGRRPQSAADLLEHGVVLRAVRQRLRLQPCKYGPGGYGPCKYGPGEYGPGERYPAAVADRPVLDRWALSELASTVTEVDEALDSFDSLRAGRRIARFVDDLSNWYVRRSRRRFWEGDPDALATLHTCLDGLTRVMAPFTPFLTDWLWSRLFAGVTPGAPDSVHLAAWPELPSEWITPGLPEQMDLVRRIVELGRAARASSGVRTRQPLPRAVVGASAYALLTDELRVQIAEELNVVSVEVATSDVVDVTVKPNFRALGRRFGKRTPLVAKAVGGAGAPVDGRLVVEVDGERLELSGDELIVSETPREGWAVTAESGLSVALDLEVTPKLARAGLARDVVRVVQDARKAAGLDVTDRIELWWTSTSDETATALREHATTVAGEVLAVGFAEGAPPAPAPDLTQAGAAATGPVVSPDLALTFTLRRVARAS